MLLRCVSYIIVFTSKSLLVDTLYFLIQFGFNYIFLEYKKACVVTVYVYHGNSMVGQHKFEFTSRSDSLYRLLYGALDPISFMCEALQISPPELHELDHSLAVTFQTRAPPGFEFLNTRHEEVTG